MTARGSCLRLLSILCLVTSLSSTAARAAPAPRESRDLFGIWCESRGKTPPAQLKQQCPWLKGALVQLKWQDLEPKDGQFDWPYFDSAISKFTSTGLYVTLQVWAGPASPDWLAAAGVPFVKTSGKGDANPKHPHDTFPYYLDPRYKALYERMLRAVAAHLDTLPKPIRENLVCLQSAEGSTGDAAAYKGAPIDKKFQIDPTAWNQFKRDTWSLLDTLYRDKQPKVHLLITVGAREDEDDDQTNSAWLIEHLPDAWRKATGPCQMYQMRGENARLRVGDPLYFTPDANGNPRTRCRGELSVSESGWFQDAPIWNMYWMNLWVLHFGVDMFMLKSQDLQDPRYQDGFRFFSRYAGIKDPAASPGAWCALRDGLDGNDHQRFPDSRFGQATRPKRKNLPAAADRSVKIAQSFAGRGALQPDPAGLSSHATPEALNDVGWDIYPGNYGRFLTQFDPNGTSVGHWRVGPKDQPFGRFARGFDTASGRNAMYFSIADGFFAHNPLNAAAPVRLRIVYFDSGAGRFAVQYDAVSGQKTALEITKTATNRWREATVNLSDAYLGHRLPNHTDLILLNTGHENTLFHLLELTRLPPSPRER